MVPAFARFFIALLLSCTAFGSGLIHTRVADAFDFPVGTGTSTEGYYKARGFRSNGHLGEDWNGRNGGNSDLGAPVLSIANGYIYLARDIRLGWGNVVIIRHAFYENGEAKYVDSLYGHLHEIFVKEGQQVTRGQKIGTIGNNRGMYNAHLHFEIRKNLDIGMHRASYAMDESNYHDPTAFIAARRTLRGGPKDTLLAANTIPSFTAPAATLAPPGVSPEKVTIIPNDTTVKRTMVVKRTLRTFKVERYSDIDLDAPTQ